jgi:hypothetical protein
MAGAVSVFGFLRVFIWPPFFFPCLQGIDRRLFDGRWPRLWAITHASSSAKTWVQLGSKTLARWA